MRLPQLQARPQQAERPSQAAVRPTDLGLGAVAQDAAAWEGEVRRTQELELEVTRAEADQAVDPIVSEVQSAFETKFAESGARWDGASPGFARAQSAELQADLAPVLARDDLTPVQRDALQRRLSAYGEAVGQRAIKFESQKRGGIVAEQAQAREMQGVGSATASYMVAMAQRQAALDARYDGSTGDYLEQSLANHDEVAPEIIAAQPPARQARVAQVLEQQRLQLVGRGLDVQARTEQDYNRSQAGEAGDKLLNAVITAPTMLDAALMQVPDTVAALQPEQRREAAAHLTDGLVAGALGAMIRSGDHDIVLSRLNSGEFDGSIRPQTKEQLVSMATTASERMDVDAIVAQQDMADAVRDDIASRLTTGVGVEGVDEARIVQTLGAAEAAKWRRDVAEADQTRAAVTGYADLDEGEMRERVAGLAPKPGQADFADASARYEMAQKAMEAELKARRDDPAAWAMTAAPSMGARFNEIGQGDPAASRRAAARYAAAQQSVQQAAGIPSSQRRVLPIPMAEKWRDDMATDADPGHGLAVLGARIGAFAPPPGADSGTINRALANQRMVINELQKTHVPPADLAAAVDLSGNAAAMGRYVAGRRSGAMAALETREKTALETAVQAEMADYQRSFAGIGVSAGLAAGRNDAVEVMAAELMRTQGLGARPAAQVAARAITGRYRFVGPSAFRMPANLAEAREPGHIGNGARRVNIGDTVSGAQLADRGSRRILSGLLAHDGAALAAPNPPEWQGMTEPQRRRRYADAVGLRARWMSTADDQGAILMMPTTDGRWTPVSTASGNPIAQTHEAIIAAGRDRPHGGAPPASRPPPGRAAGGGAGQAPRGIRNRNPGNIEFRAGNAWQGQVGSDGRFAVFRTDYDGLRALSVDLGTKMGRGLRSVRSIISAYAPPHENNTAAYIRTVATALGVSADAPLSALDPGLRARLMSAIVRHENGQHPYAPELISRAARAGIRR